MAGVEIDATGDGSGSGSGYGYGDGSGYGGSYKSYWLATIPYFSSKWPLEQQKRLAELQHTSTVIAFWKSDKHGRACNGGGFEKSVKPGTVQVISGPLEVCTRRALHATMLPPRWKGDRLWIVALIGEFQRKEDKYGALTREIIGECL